MNKHANRSTLRDYDRIVYLSHTTSGDLQFDLNIILIVITAKGYPLIVRLHYFDYFDNFIVSRTDLSVGSFLFFLVLLLATFFV